MGRAPCCDKANVKKGPWSPEEDSKLKDYIHKHGSPGNWIALPPKAGLRRCGKSCRLRWLNYLRPNIKHGDFTDDEDTIICNLFSTIGSRWSIIAAQLPGRTDNDIKNYWNTKLKKKLLGMMMMNAAATIPSSSSSQKRIPAAGTTHHHHQATTNYYYNTTQHQAQLTTRSPAAAASPANGGLMDDNNYYFSSSTSSLLINNNTSSSSLISNNYDQFHVSSVDHPPPPAAADDVMSMILGRSRSTLGIKGDQASSSSCSTDGSSTYDYGASRHVINVNNYSNHDLMMMHNNYNYNYNYNYQLENSLEEIKQLITTNLCSNNFFVHEIKTEEEEKEQNINYNY